MNLTRLLPLLASSAVLTSAPARAQSEDCCSRRLNLGFSTERVSSATPFEGILGVDTSGKGERCEAGQAEIVTLARRGEQAQAIAYVNLISQLEAASGVQAWSLVMGLEGEGVPSLVTHEDTAGNYVPDGLRPLGEFTFELLCFVDPAQSGGRRGFVSTIVLCFTCTSPVMMPPVGTESILKVGARAEFPQGPQEQVATLRFENGLWGPCVGVPLDNGITVNANTELACNQGTATLRLVFRKRPDSNFRRGDTTADGVLNLTDGVAILNFLFLGGAQPTCLDAADTDDGGNLNISDGIRVFNYLFLGGNPPSAPGPHACGPDAGGDELACDSYPLCP